MCELKPLARLRLFDGSERAALERLFSFEDSSRDAARLLEGGPRGGLRALHQLGAKPSLSLRDGICSVRWQHPTDEPLPIAVRLLDWLRDRAGSRPAASSDDRAGRRYRRWPPPAKRPG